MEETSETTQKNKHEIPLLRIALALKEGEIAVDRVERTQGLKPAGEIDVNDDVPSAVIGHWLEVTDKAGKAVYRRYVQRNLPINANNADSRLQRIYSLEKYRIFVPDLPQGHELTLYEQSLSGENCKKLTRHVRLKLGLMSSRSKAGSV